jgi:nucleotide-binding universal stress UspA family protein
MNVILSVDLADESVMPSKSAWKSLDSFMDGIQGKVEAVHVLQYPKRLLADPGIQKATKRDLEHFVDKCGLMNLSGSRILEGSTSLKHSIEILLGHAEKRKTKMIVAVSHGRKWLVRFVMGSFSEALLSMSPIPVLFMSRKAVIKGNRLLFITDFSKPSKAAFRIFLDQFRDLDQELLIYHALPPLYEYTAMMETYPPESRKYADDQMDLMVKEAEKSGWSVRSIVEENVLDIPKGVMKTVKNEQIALIGFSSIATRYGLAFVGNVAKRIFRLDGVNKWVCGPKAIEKVLKKGKVPSRSVPAHRARLPEIRA